MKKKSIKSLKKIFQKINSQKNLLQLQTSENTIKKNLLSQNWKIKIDKNQNILLKKKIEKNRIKIFTEKTHFNSRFENEENFSKIENPENPEFKQKNIIYRNINFIMKIYSKNDNGDENKLILNSDTNEGGLIVNSVYFNESNFYRGPKFEDLDGFLQVLFNRFFYEFGVDKEFISCLELLSAIEYFKDMDEFNHDFVEFLS